MNQDLQKLQPYPFERLRDLLADAQPPADKPLVDLGIGEPRHPTPRFIAESLSTSLNDGLSRYPATRGKDPLCRAIAAWLETRFRLDAGQIDADSQVLPVAGTREGLFSVAQALVDRQAVPLVMMPNPFYQIYEGAALLAGAEPRFLHCDRSNGYLPDPDALPPEDWDRCQLLYLCSPGNPSGAVIGKSLMQRFLDLADRHDFILVADECYSELYPNEDTPPPGLLQICAETGRTDFRRCLVFHSLSKRSNAPGLRSGFVAGDAAILREFLRYRTYHGCALPEHVQQASAAAWADEAHVRENRRLYREKFDAVLAILGDCLEVSRPEAGFYLWPRTPVDDQDFARRLYQEEHVRVLPGSYLSRDTALGNPGRNHVRMALVADQAHCEAAAHRIRALVRRL
ncbi:succinyldiaminopimelate transaminase [Methylonatrum kenyense]|uniref:succinyldiaminopimelate transaminase n=1 Tax=Methylonatrum kenyense TaxID=455253 RepID=UPI0020C09ABB|nr:succinyldiaminopimelate transaminase [Methylonatrum kenyense]MCK8514726.1 succinyldiaminopimelate transaminase [Methylonatrum kenyense]